MKRQLTHDRAIEELEVVALGAAPNDVTAAMQTHAADCAECKAELEDFTRMLAELTVLVPNKLLNRGRSAGIRSRLLARAGADLDAASRRRIAAQQAPRAVPTAERPTRATAPDVRPTPVATPLLTGATPRPSRAPAGVGWWAALATIGLVIAVSLLLWVWGDRRTLLSRVSNLDLETASRLDSLTRVVQERDEALVVLASPGVRIINLTNFSNIGRPLGRMFWDTRTQRWSLFVYELQPARPGRGYQVWLVTPDGRQSGGVFNSAEDGTAYLSSRQETSGGVPRAVTITEEPAGGSYQPTGTVVMAGGGGS